MTNYLIKKKFDGELRQKMAHRLATEHGIKREEKPKSTHVRKMPWLGWGIGLAAAFLIGVFTWQSINGADTAEYQDLTRSYLAMHYQNNELRKGSSATSLQRLKSVDAYNEGDFATSAYYREMVTASPEATTEDFFFQGIAYLYQKPPEAEKAIAPLIRAGAAPTGELYEEARWHLALAYLETEQLGLAREILEERHQAGTWNAERAAKLLQKIPKQ